MSDTSGKNRRLATRIAGAGRRREWTGDVVNPPIWRGSTHLYQNAADLARGRPNTDGHFYYGRRGSPTQWALADALTQLEPGAAGTVLYNSGVAAIVGSILAVVKTGDVVLMTDNAYEPSRNFARTLLTSMGVETRFFDPLDRDAYAALFCDRTTAVLLESPGSLSMEVCDVPTFAAIAREKGAISFIDNTWASSLGFAALEHGCDVAIMSLTKHVGGHSDLMMGSASAGPEIYEKLRTTSQVLGQVVSPDDAALALRGLRTIGLRLERASASARQVAEWLSFQPQVAHVLCPMLPGAPGHEIWARDFAGGCGLFSFALKGAGMAQRDAFIDALKLFGLGYSWGGYESLAIPFDPSRARSATPWPPKGWDAGDRQCIRLAIGLEDTEDLMEDLEAGFAAMARA